MRSPNRVMTATTRRRCVADRCARSRRRGPGSRGRLTISTPVKRPARGHRRRPHVGVEIEGWQRDVTTDREAAAERHAQRPLERHLVGGDGVEVRCGSGSLLGVALPAGTGCHSMRPPAAARPPAAWPGRSGPMPSPSMSDTVGVAAAALIPAPSPPVGVGSTRTRALDDDPVGEETVLRRHVVHSGLGVETGRGAHRRSRRAAPAPRRGRPPGCRRGAPLGEDAVLPAVDDHLDVADLHRDEVPRRDVGDLRHLVQRRRGR